MPNYAPALPLTVDSVDGFTNLKDFRALIRQNLTMILLTNPGERVMLPEFGVGLRKLLFSPKRTSSDGSTTVNGVKIFGDAEDVDGFLSSEIEKQVSSYLDLVTILEIKIQDLDDNSIKVLVEYAVPSINIYETVTFIESGGVLTTSFSETIPAENRKLLNKYTNRQDRILVTDIKDP